MNNYRYALSPNVRHLTLDCAVDYNAFEIFLRFHKLEFNSPHSGVKPLHKEAGIP